MTVRATVLALVLALVGCLSTRGEPLADAYPDEDLITVALEEWPDDVPDKCLRYAKSSRVLLVDLESVHVLCETDDKGVRGCAATRRGPDGRYPLIVAWEDTSVLRYILVHELVHVLSRCMGPDGDIDHEGEAFDNYPTGITDPVHTDDERPTACES